MPKIIGNVELYMGPHQTGAFDNLEEIIVDFINAAQSRLEVAVQELDSPQIAEALIRARQRKVAVKVVTEHNRVGKMGSGQAIRLRLVEKCI